MKKERNKKMRRSEQERAENKHVEQQPVSNVHMYLYYECKSILKILDLSFVVLLLCCCCYC